MCVLALAWRAHPRWRLVLAANRDELHARPAAPLASWVEDPQILAGRDLASGGTWLGVSGRGRLAVVTNLHTGARPVPTAPSRGLLLKTLLTDPHGSGHPAPDTLADYNPFSLITVAGGRAVFASNHPQPETHDLAPGLYGLSNATLDTPWPKTERLKASVAAWLAQGDPAPDALLDALTDEQRIAAPQGPADSPIFIRNATYGTRCSTVVAIDDAGSGVIVERRFTPESKPDGETELPFRWPSGPG